MEKVGLSVPTVNASGAANGDAVIHNYLSAAALADQEQRQNWRFIARAYDIPAAGRGIAREPGASPEVACRPVFAGGRMYYVWPVPDFPSQRLLLEGNRTVQPGSRALDILTVLVERAGHVVGKNELIARAFGRTYSWRIAISRFGSARCAGAWAKPRWIEPAPARAISLRYRGGVTTLSRRSVSPEDPLSPDKCIGSPRYDNC